MLSTKLAKPISYLTILIILAILVFFLVWPVSLIVSKAFMGPEGFTLNYFVLLFSNDLQTTSIKNSVMIGILTTIIATIVSLPLAIFNTKFDFKGKGLLSGLLLVPMVMPPFVGAIGMQRFFARFGSINIMLLEWGVIEKPIDWLSGSRMFWAVVLLEVLHFYPIMYLNLSAAFSNVDPSLEEMASTLGARKFHRIRTILWPLAKPGFLAGAIIIFIWALTDLGTPLLVGYHDTIPVKIFNLVTDINENPVGYAMVCVVMLLTVAFFAFSKFALGRKRYDMMAKGHVSSPIKRASFLSQCIIYPTFIFTIFIALIPHITVLITSLSDGWFMTALPEHYSTQYYQMVFEQELSMIGIKNSLFLSAMATLFDLVVGLLVAYVVTRKLIPMASFLDALVMIPMALPGIVLAFGYVVAYSDTFLDPLHNPVPLLVIAYGIRRLPYMVRSATAGLQQMSLSLEEASSTLGASHFTTMRKITIPLVTANLIAGGLLCFSYAMLDVSDSLILAMKDQFYPITKAIYVLYLEQGSGEFVASALGVIAMIIIGLCIMGASLILGKKMGELFRS